MTSFERENEDRVNAFFASEKHQDFLASMQGRPGVQEEPDDDEAAARAEKALEARARRAAKAVGFIARKSRAQTYCFNNQLGFQVLDEFSGFPVYGWNYELTAQDVIDWCTGDPE